MNDQKDLNLPNIGTGEITRNSDTIPSKYQNLPSGLIAELSKGEVSKGVLQNLKQNEIQQVADEKDKFIELYNQLPGSFKEQFQKYQQSATQKITEQIKNGSSLAGFSPMEVYVVGKLGIAYRELMNREPDAIFMPKLQDPTDGQVLENLINRFALEELKVSMENADKRETTDIMENVLPQKGNEKSVVDASKKQQIDQQKLNLSASLITNYFDGKSNLGFLTDYEKKVLETLRGQYDQQKIKQLPLVLSLQSISPELKKLFFDLPVLFKQGDRRTPSQEISPKKGITEWENVTRATEVAAVGDLFGSEKAFRGNLDAIGAIEESNGELRWKGGDKKIVFLGDILGDREPHGIDDILKIGDLNNQAEKVGGSLEIIAGNHEDFFVSFLMGVDAGGSALAFESCKSFDYVGLLELGRFGSAELKNVNLDNFLSLPMNEQNDIWLKLKGERTQILENMRNDSEGRKILDSLCNMKVASIVDDNLFVHTDPTLRMVRTIVQNGSENVEKTIEAINKCYQQSLRENLIEGKPISQFQLFMEIKDTFLDTNNRDSFFENASISFNQSAMDQIVSQIRASGINAIIHGHSDRTQTPPKDLLVTSVDLSAFKNKYSNPNERSVLEINKDGIVRKGGKKDIVRQ